MNASFKITNPVSGLVRDVSVFLKELVIRANEMGVPTELHLWVVNEHSIMGEKVQSEEPRCLVVKLDEDISTSQVDGINLPANAVMQAILGWSLKHSNSLPLNAENVELPILPAGLERALIDRQKLEDEADAHRQKLTAETDALRQVVSELHEEQAKAEQRLLQLRETATQEYAAIAARMEELNASVFALTTQDSELKMEITRQQEAVAALEQSIREKSDESTRLALLIEDQKKQVQS